MRPSLSTRTGDKGDTGLFGGTRVSKADARLHAYGTVDELNACLGVVLAEGELPEEIAKQLHTVQRMLFVVGSDLATPLEASSQVPRVEQAHVTELEQWGANLEQTLPALKRFILPSGCLAGALLHQARTLTRRAERWMVSLSEREALSPHVLVYMNRLSDYFFLAARTVNKAVGVAEREWIAEETTGEETRSRA